ncbi:hypothetical protein RERY_00440 [Rhodococcus erythropolis]|nr:hypothetical protein [Rhodococcus erythropolis]OFV79343.1 hypothetical protein RERY_00440 [Rhodococcus erythropolis]
MKWAGQTLIPGLNSRWTASHSMPDNPKRQSWDTPNGQHGIAKANARNSYRN